MKIVVFNFDIMTENVWYFLFIFLLTHSKFTDSHDLEENNFIKMSLVVSH